jgi:hypothetical protein
MFALFGNWSFSVLLLDWFRPNEMCVKDVGEECHLQMAVGGGWLTHKCKWQRASRKVNNRVFLARFFLVSKKWCWKRVELNKGNVRVKWDFLLVINFANKWKCYMCEIDNEGFYYAVELFSYAAEGTRKFRVTKRLNLKVCLLKDQKLNG